MLSLKASTEYPGLSKPSPPVIAYGSSGVLPSFLTTTFSFVSSIASAPKAAYISLSLKL
jgi:hypothetical protein